MVDDVDVVDEDLRPVEESISSIKLADLLTDSQGARFLSFQRRRARSEAMSVPRTLFFPEGCSTADDSSHDGMICSSGVEDTTTGLSAIEDSTGRSSGRVGATTLFYGERATEESRRYHPSSGLGGGGPASFAGRQNTLPRRSPPDSAEGLIARNRDFAAVGGRFVPAPFLGERSFSPLSGGGRPSPLSGGGPVRRAVDEEE